MDLCGDGGGEAEPQCREGIYGPTWDHVSERGDGAGGVCYDDGGRRATALEWAAPISVGFVGGRMGGDCGGYALSAI